MQSQPTGLFCEITNGGDSLGPAGSVFSGATSGSSSGGTAGGDGSMAISVP